MKRNYYEIFVRKIGRSMRFFLNSSLALMISSSFSLFILLDLQKVTPMSLLLGGIPLVTAVFFFITSILILKRIEKYAIATRSIDILSNIISEYNKSYIIKLLIGKIDSVIEI
jgi:hypothetical protein